MTAASDNRIDDSQVELPAFAPSEALPVQNGLASEFDSASSEVLLASEAYDRFINSWGRFHFYGALGVGVASIAALGFFLVRAIAGQTINVSTTAVVIGCVAMVALLLLSLTASALCLLVLAMGRTIRQLIALADLNPKSTVTGVSKGRAGLSRTAV